MKAPYWLAVIGAVLAVILGAYTRHRRQLEDARRRTEAAYQEAMNRGDQAAAATRAAELASIELDLERERQRPIDQRLQQALADARARRGAKG